MRTHLGRNGPTLSNRPLSEVSVAGEFLAELGELAQVRTVRDFALLSHFPEHCATLADWLGVRVEVIRSIAARAAALIPADELKACADRIRPTLRFPLGIRPPCAA